MRLALSVLTRIPVRPRDIDRPSLTFAPIVGAAIGGVGAGVVAAVPPRSLGAVFAVVAMVLLSGALHLDGLADSADALGVRGDAVAVRAAMKAHGVGAFGVVAIVLVLLVDVAALAATRHPTAALLTTGAASRLSATLACRRSVRAATREGLGAWIAGSTTRGRATFAIVSTLAFIALAPIRAPIAIATALIVGEAVRVFVSRRTGGLTGDVLGAMIECSAAAAYCVFAF